jgi:hypothetical protein
MKKVIVVLTFVLVVTNCFAQKKVILFVNIKNECLGCNIGINNLFKELNQNKINTTLYFKGITPYQLEKFRKEIDFNLNNFTLINMYSIYEDELYSKLKLRSNDSYFVVIDNEKIIYKCNLIRLIETPSEQEKLNTVLLAY